MPAGLIKQQDRVSTALPGGDLVEMELHGFGVASRQPEGNAMTSRDDIPVRQRP
jgi:hypothetical protein